MDEITAEQAMKALLELDPGFTMSPNATVLHDFIQQQRTRPPHGEVRVVKTFVVNDRDYEAEMATHVPESIDLKPGQSLAIVEPSPGVTLGREVLEKVREALTEAVANLCDGGPGCCEPARARALAEAAIALLKDSPHA